MTTAAATPTSALHHARQVAGMAILALANPLVWYSQAPVIQWAVTWIVPLLIALVAFGLFALFFTKRAKQAWPGRFYMLCWILLVLVLAGPWINMGNRGTNPVTTSAPTEKSSDEFDPSRAVPVNEKPIDWEKGVMTPPPQR